MMLKVNWKYFKELNYIKGFAAGWPIAFILFSSIEIGNSFIHSHTPRLWLMLLETTVGTIGCILLLAIACYEPSRR